MAVGMTLNQLYAPPASTPSCAPDAVPLSAAAAASLSPPPQGHSPPSARRTEDPKPLSTTAHMGAMQQQQQPLDHRIYQMPYATSASPYALQYASQSVTSTTSTAATSCPTNLLFHPLTKPGPSTSEDYAADPLPFEYSSRKYSPSMRDDGSSSTSTSTSASSSNFNDSYTSHSMYAASPCATQPQQQQPQQPQPQRGTSPYGHHPHHYSEPGRGNGCYPHPSPPDMASPLTPQRHFPRSSTAPPHLYSAMPSAIMLPSHAFPPPLLDASAAAIPKKEVDAFAHSAVYSSNGSTSSASGGAGHAQEAMIKVKTPLKLKYWRNGRRNLQCFPSCKVFGDYSAIKIEDLKQHDFMWGKCRGSLVTEVTLNSTVRFDDVVLLGRVHSLENIPVAFEEAVIRECMLGRTIARDEMEAMKDQWIMGERLPDFGQQEGHVACFEFKPKVWKYTEDMAQGKCKRRNVKYYVQFEAFVHVGSAATSAAAAAAAGDRRYYACIGSGMSTSFEVGSSRVLARQKRKAATCVADSVGGVPTSLTSSDLMQSQQLLALNGGNALMHHNVMTATPHAMYAPSSAFQPHHEGQSRSLPPTFPHPQVVMHQMASQPEVVHYSMSSQQQQQQQQQLSYRQQEASSQLSVGDKRKMSSERPAFLTDRSVKMLKVMSGVPQSVPI